MSAVPILTVLWGAGPSAQAPGLAPSLSAQYRDPVRGLSLQDAIAQAVDNEPSLRAARTEIDVARAMRQQAELRPNPSAAFDRREEPGGTDNQTMVSVEWPLDLFRRDGRIAVADRQVAATELAVMNRRRLLASDVRMRYGDVMASIRESEILDALVEAARRQLALVRSRVDEGAAPTIQRDLLDVELQRLEADRLLQIGSTEAAIFELKRVIGIPPAAPLLVRDTLEDVVQRETLEGPEGSRDAAAIQQRSDVREADARIGVAEAKIDRAQRDGRIDLSVYGNYARMDAGFSQFGLAPNGSTERVHGVFHYLTGGVLVTMPLFNRNQGEVAAARAERHGAAATLDAARLTAGTEVAVARVKDDRTHQAVKLYGAGLNTLARQNLSVVDQTFELGRVTVFEVLAEQRRYLDFQRAHLAALRAAYDARTALIRALGDMP
ncbi:MAG: TolC family protein [Acidobacteriota bacterium]